MSLFPPPRPASTAGTDDRSRRPAPAPALCRRRFLAISAACALLPGAAPAEGIFHRKGIAMGAVASLSIRGLSPARAEAAARAAFAEIRRLEAIFSLYRPDSLLVRLNRDRFLDSPPADFPRLLSMVHAIHEATGGAFDPTIQPLWQAWADHRGAPGPGVLAAAGKLAGWQDVAFSSRRVMFRRPGMAMTLNGIAQGYVTDRVAQLLRARGLDNILVAAGEISASGSGGPGQGWRVGLAEREDAPAEEFLELRNMAVATSAQTGTVLDDRGRVGHILDPRSGLPAAGWRRVSVISSSATVADGLSTAFCAMAPDGIRSALGAFPGTWLIAIDSGGTRLAAGLPGGYPPPAGHPPRHRPARETGFHADG